LVLIQRTELGPFHLLDRALQPFGNAALDALGPLEAHACSMLVRLRRHRHWRSPNASGRRVRCGGLDVSAPMLAVARERANRLAAGSGARVNIDFLLADATTARWQASFDALSSRFGVMFFDDPVAAFTSLHAH